MEPPLLAPIQVAAPLFTNVRPSRLSLLVNVIVAPEASVVVPPPAIVPTNRSRLLLTVQSLGPDREELLTAIAPVTIGPATVTAPPPTYTALAVIEPGMLIVSSENDT